MEGVWPIRTMSGLLCDVPNVRILTGHLVICESDALRTYVPVGFDGRVFARSIVCPRVCIGWCGCCGPNRYAGTINTREKRYFLPVILLPAVVKCFFFFSFSSKGALELYLLATRVVIPFILNPLIFVEKAPLVLSVFPTLSLNVSCRDLSSSECAPSSLA